MPLIKICPACKAENKAESIICNFCMTDISSLSPLNTDLASEKPTNVLQEETKENPCLLVQFENHNDSIKIYNGDIIGRHCKCKELLQKYKTISRKHVTFIFENNKWYIQDLNSSNYTYLNNQKINPGTKYEIKPKDVVSLSQDVDIKIIEGM
ncbi:MAG TPA: FHA domain-containing protein [Candidatus Hydrogenedens sp.]|nr:FHA domain-containing protein [Candidatus Hydrogenedens sp.]HOK09613.1 FHA domain-containing protein [Candidatus Hydrogenedens sp.]HOL20256.1 FHA domain-containing protein [Candidatus Hydrogenedens sp.]